MKTTKLIKLHLSMRKTLVKWRMNGNFFYLIKGFYQTKVYIVENNWHAIQTRNNKSMHVIDILNLRTEVLSRDSRWKIKISVRREKKDKIVST